MNEAQQKEIKAAVSRVATQAAIVALVRSHPDKPALEKAISATSAWMFDVLMEELPDEQGRAYAQTLMDAQMSRLVAWARDPTDGR